MLAMAVLIATPALCQEDDVHRTLIQVPSRVVSVGQAHGLIFACLGLEGVAWFPTDIDPSQQAVTSRPEWPTLNILELPDDRVLLSGREARLRVVRITEEKEVEFLYDWESEGLCNASAIRGNTLAVAGGGAGVSFWDWPDQATKPKLVGRYPFNDYTKRVHFLRDDVLIAADNYETGLLVLDPSVPLKPKAHTVFNVRGFCDSAAAIGNVVFATDRVRGTQVIRLGKNPTDVEPVGYIPRRAPYDERGIVQHVTSKGSDLLIAEGHAGLRWWHTAENEFGFEEVATFDGFENVVEAIFLDENRIAAADFTRGVVILEFDREALLNKPAN
ncbi:hypothetical protein KQI84_09875 [bacterium]|nr:hypothetical protein [bacterium]